MKSIIHEDVVETLVKSFDESQLREISFAFNPDCDDITDTICKIEEVLFEREGCISLLEDKLKELSGRMEELVADLDKES